MTSRTSRSEDPLSLPARLRADCASCQALCCVAPAFLAVQGFGFDKPAQVPCPLLRGDHHCSIHARLREEGFAACASYDCHGAGQRTVALFAGASWRTSENIAARMFNVFRRLRSLHQLMAMLFIAAETAADRRQRDSLRASLGAIEDMCSGPADRIEKIDVNRLRRDVMHAVSSPPALAPLPEGEGGIRSTTSAMLTRRRRDSCIANGKG